MLTQIRLLVRNIPLLITIVVTNSTPSGSILGIFLRKKIRRLNINQFVGIQLAGFAFVAGVIVPQSQETFATLMVSGNEIRNVIVLEQSADLYQWPLRAFGISQDYSITHPGMDLTDPVGTPVFPIAEGTVALIQHSPYGYGSHILVRHDNDTQSLYAHLSRIDVNQDDRITKKTQLGLVGLTGWTTGSHLHMEIYQNNIPTNPIEVLPEIKTPDSL